MSASDSPSINAAAMLRNPIIGENREETLFNAGCVAEMLARLHSDLADAAFAGGVEAGTTEAWRSKETRGLSIICASLAAAIFFELEDRQ